MSESVKRVKSSTAAGRRYAGESRAQRDAARRERLLEAALELYARNGYAATTVDGLCTQARISLRSFYELVPDRETLLIMLYEGIIGEMIPRMAVAMRGADSNLQAICDAGVRAAVEAFVEDERLARIVFVEILGVSPEVERYRMQGRGRIADMLVEAARRIPGNEKVSNGVLRWRIIGMIGAFQAILMQWLGEGVTDNVELLIETLSVGVAGILLSDGRPAGAGLV